MRVSIEPRPIGKPQPELPGYVERVRWGVFPQEGKGTHLGPWHDTELSAIRWARARGHDVASDQLWGYSDDELGERDTDGTPGSATQGQLTLAFTVSIRAA